MGVGVLCGMVEVTGQGKTMRVQADAINIIRKRM
jgi:hypothetical protein